MKCCKVRISRIISFLSFIRPENMMKVMNLEVRHANWLIDMQLLSSVERHISFLLPLFGMTC